ncbi:hypothetical protein T4D_9570, partial [Trichinella pseudospiralis]
LTYVATGSIVKPSLSSFKAFTNYRSPENADDTKQIEDDTKQNCAMKTYGICGSPRVPILSQFWRFSEEFIEIPKPFAIFLSIRKINFSSFSAHFD